MNNHFFQDSQVPEAEHFYASGLGICIGTITNEELKFTLLETFLDLRWS